MLFGDSCDECNRFWWQFRYPFGFALLPGYNREPYYGLVVYVLADLLPHWQALGINRVFYTQLPEGVAP
jgi:hypothetical protein